MKLKQVSMHLKAKLGEMKGNYFIYLAGSASVEGSASYNQSLSTKRCNALSNISKESELHTRFLLLPYGKMLLLTEKQAREYDRAKNRSVWIST